MTFRSFFGMRILRPHNFLSQVCDLVERHIWALGKGLDQWQGPPDDDEEEQKEDEEEEEKGEERVKLNCQTQASKYTK